MIVFELPKETEQISILDKVYEVDITDFLIIDEIKKMPSMENGFRPASNDMQFHISEIKTMIAKILGTEINLPQKTPDKEYIILRSLLKQIHDFYAAKQAEYLDFEYSAIKDELERLRLFDSIYKNMPKGADAVEQSNSRKN